VLVGDVAGGGEGPGLERFESVDLPTQAHQQGLLVTRAEEDGLGLSYGVQQRSQVVDHPKQRVWERDDCLAHVLTLGATTDTSGCSWGPLHRGTSRILGP